MREHPPQPYSPPKGMSSRLPTRAGFLRFWVDLRHFAVRLVLRFDEDRCAQMAAGLSYATLLALVPLLAIALALLTAFPAFDDAQVQLKMLIFEALPPQQAIDASNELDRLLENVAGLTGPGVLALAVTSILLLANINTSLNAIWRVREPRSLALQLLVYWALLTVGPLLLGASISISSVAFAQVHAQSLGVVGEGLLAFARLLAIVLAALGFTVFFFVVPNRQVSFISALIGGTVAALGFELLKFGFGLYISNFPSYQIVYGALAALPILLIWIYLLWTVVLIGAEVAALIPEWRAAYRRGYQRCGPLDRLPLALALIARLRQAQRDGTQPRLRSLTSDLPMPPEEVDLVLDHLLRGGFVAAAAGGRFVLARDLERVTLRTLLHCLDLTLERTPTWPPPVPQVLQHAGIGLDGPLDQPLELLFGSEVKQSGEAAAEPSARPVSLP